MGIETLNKINEHALFESPWKEWEIHRSRIINYWESDIFKPGHKYDKILIVGAGNMNDLDMKHLCSIGNFKELHIMDFDGEAMKRGLSKQGITDSRIKMFDKVDFTGLNDTNFYNDIDDLFEKRVSQKKISKILRTTAIKTKTEKIAEDSTYDLIISYGVHSQLVVPVLWSYMNARASGAAYTKKEVKNIDRDIADLLRNCEACFTKSLMAALKPNGYLNVCLDVAEYKLDSADGMKYYLQMHNDYFSKQMSIEELTPIIMNGPNKHSSATQQIAYSVRDGYLENIVLNGWLWPFSDEKYYFVFFQLLQKK